MDTSCLRVLALITIIAFTKFHTTRGQVNRPPVWDESSVKNLKDGIREDTKIGTSLAQLRCVDDDTGDVIEYVKTKGSAVSVTSLGLVTLAVDLDFEDKDSIGYDLGFSCVDRDPLNGFRAKSQPVVFELEMTVDDANDIAPQFSVSSEEGYTFTVSEAEQPPYTLTPRIDLVDGDRGLNAELSQFYLICNSVNATEIRELPETSIATCQKFRLSYSQTGEGVFVANLILKDSLDYETRPVYSSKLIAIDNPQIASARLSTTINIQIKVEDAQDVGPVFVNLGASTLVSEGAKRGDSLNMVIQARDGDYGDKRPVKIVMLDDPKNAFTLDASVLETQQPESGIYEARLRVNNALDRESIVGAYHFVVKVIELDKTTLAETDATATATYSIQITDVDDEAPEFEQKLYPINVTEMEDTTESVQITGLRILCNDKDEPQNAKYNVRVVSQTFPDVFSISPTLSFTGTAIMFLTVNNAKFLDYDKPEYRQQTVVLVAESASRTNPLSSSTTIKITLLDINDNRPQFEKSSYTFQVREDITVLPHFIDSVKAVDEDTGENGRITYRLEGGTTNKFEIDSTTGAVRLMSKVNFEQTPLYVFLVYAEDHGQDGQVSQVQVTVEVVNVNDQYPKFESLFYSTTVNEDQLIFLTPIVIQASDNEEGTGTINYRIISGQTADNAFNLNSVSGTLTLNRKLDYAQAKNGIYELEVEATDNGIPALTAVVKVQIQVIDQNNFKPVINPKVYPYTITELVKPGTVVATIKGTDEDQGEFGKITYRISSGAFDNFVIDPESGVVTVNNPNNLDWDKEKFYSIKIIGSDGGAPQLFDEATVAITVTDSNNKKPLFKDTIYIATVDEVRPEDFVILTVVATDPDSTKNLFYSIEENSIRARNGAGNLLTSTRDYDYKAALGVDGTSGNVYIKNKLDKEKALEIIFNVQVEDLNSENGPQTDLTQVSITVTGEANTDLSFDPIQQIHVSEGSPKGYEITTVVARDPTTQNSITNYQQLDNSPFFKVNQTTGQVSIKNEIDYETDSHIHRIVVVAIANDNIRSATATVTIKINDDNDNKPQFDKTVYNANVDEDAPPLTRVVNIYATDRDTTSFGPIEYSIAGGLDSGHFELYKSSRGVDVLVARGVTLDYNNRQAYELDIVAIDNPQKTFSNNQQFSLVKLNIKVIDKNNHSPKFREEDNGIRRMAVPETAPQGTSVGTILATDADYGVNGEVTYDLRAVKNDDESQRALTLFSIVPKAGIITVARDSLVGFGGNVYTVIVFAQDGGEPFLSSERRVEIEVLSTENNDGNPIWHRPSNNYVFFAPEETPKYVVKENGQQKILDAAPRTGNDIHYTLSNLSSNAESFHIDPVLGVITVLDSLDREVKASYNLLVYAEDTSSPLKIRTGRQIIIRLTDKDDNRPTFSNPENYTVCGEPIDRPLEYSFYEEVPKDKMIFQLSACDPDEDSHIVYSLYNNRPECNAGNQISSDYFRLDTNGKIVTKKNIDYEDSYQTFTICAIALQSNDDGSTQSTNPSQMPHNVAYVIFHVMDVNDNGPKFPEDKRSAVMMTDARDLPIIVMDAVDADGKGFNVPIYSIIDSKFFAPDTRDATYPGNPFVIKNNELHPDPPRGYTFQEFNKGRFVLTIQAEDPVDPEFTDTQEVTVYIHDKGLAMKVILNMPPDEGIDQGNDIVRDLNDVNSKYAFRYLHVSVHENRDGINKRKTDVCFIAVNQDTHTILGTFELAKEMAKREYKGTLDEDDYKIDGIGKCYPSTSSEEQMKWKDLWWVLVFLAIFMGFCAICFIVIIFFMYRKYRRYMETEKTYLVPQ